MSSRHRPALLVLTLLAFAPAPSGAAERAPVRNADDYRAFVESDTRDACAFDISGTVSAVQRKTFFVLDDGCGRLPIRTDVPSGVVPGDRVRVTGRLTHRSPDNRHPRTFWHSLVAERVVRTGHGPPPPAARATLAEIAQGRHYLAHVETVGTVDELVPDDVDPGYLILVLRDGTDTVLVSIPATAHLSSRGRGLVDARVQVTGFCLFNLSGARKLTGWHILATSPAAVRLLQEPDDAPPAVRRLKPLTRVGPETVAALGRCKVAGRVLATWNGNRLLIRTDDGQLVPVERADEAPDVAVGQTVEVIGTAETDLFRVKLSNARVKPGPAAPAPDANVDTDTDKPALGPSALYRHENGKTAFNADCFGRRFAAEGRVKSLPFPGIPSSRLIVECDGLEIPVAVPSPDALPRGLETGARVRLTGILVFEADNWRPTRPFPVITSLFVVTRAPGDLVVTAAAPFWTRAKLALALGVLLLALGATLAWTAILRRLVERRGRALAEEAQTHAETELKIGERTRLAVELHDSVAQNLTGAALAIRSATRALPPACETVAARLDLALKTVNASRDDLRNCIWDLRNRALEAADFESAIRLTLEPIAADARMRIRFAAARDLFTDTTAHAILSIIRELVSNAIRHGGADVLTIAGALERGQLRFSVKDNGRGFDPAACLGQEQGHFGLQGVRERAKSFGGDVSISSHPGGGTKVTVAVTLPTEQP